MKKIAGLLLIALLVGISAPAAAQLKFGIKGGINIASVSFNSDVLKSGNLTGFHVGPMLEAGLPLLGLGIDAALLYTQKGMDVSNPINSTKLRTDYIDVPVNLKWKLGLPIFKVYFAAGPYIGFRVGGDKIWEIPGQLGEQIEAKSFNAGLNFGAGAELFNHLQVGLNYGLGLTNDFSASSIDLKAKNRGWSITAAILF